MTTLGALLLGQPLTVNRTIYSSRCQLEYYFFPPSAVCLNNNINLQGLYVWLQNAKSKTC